MEFLTAREAQILTNLGTHYHNASVAYNLQVVLEDVKNATLHGHMQVKTLNLNDEDIPSLIEALRALGFNARSGIDKEDDQYLETSW
ncbi:MULTISPECIES: hypothetical protein [Oxalobacteraceae]|uniref:Uncharacterized protein n=1 Tax=Herminiimonas aquatilis TaxID=345342 RepID=A0ABW2JA51_9BURK|nr:hypothetical protein [Janthinobacterium sp. Marseille]